MQQIDCLSSSLLMDSDDGRRLNEARWKTPRSVEPMVQIGYRSTVIRVIGCAYNN